MGLKKTVLQVTILYDPTELQIDKKSLAEIEGLEDLGFLLMQKELQYERDLEPGEIKEACAELGDDGTFFEKR